MSQNEERMKAMQLADMPLLADHYQKLSDRENSGGATAMATSGGGGKGGRPDIDVRGESGQQHLAEMQAKFNNDGSYGYYNNQGGYVPFYVDAFDGGGMDTNNTFFEGAGPISTLLNVAKIAPYGQSETPREQIGFRDITDMMDRGGPQASGGKFQGAGSYSGMMNFIDELSGATIPDREEYVYDENGNFVPRKITLLGG
jgi:hypothetical protein